MFNFSERASLYPTCMLHLSNAIKTCFFFKKKFNASTSHQQYLSLETYPIRCPPTALGLTTMPVRPFRFSSGSISIIVLQQPTPSCVHFVLLLKNPLSWPSKQLGELTSWQPSSPAFFEFPNRAEQSHHCSPQMLFLPRSQVCSLARAKSDGLCAPSGDFG